MRSSDSSSHSRGSFHVFLSFRGHDVRNTFLGHLHDALIREGIRAYIDGEDLQRGKEITPSLKKAIQDSRIAIVVFSENYASSCWCLDELTEIMKHQKQGKLDVKPVYLRVEPREVRTPRYSFAEALATHELMLGKDSDMVRRWREALFEAGNLSGWTLDVNGNEANQALQLFSKHAFRENDKANIAKDLIDRCLAYCDGLPLALMVLGSLLRNREERHWKSTLKLLKQGPCEEINKVLRVSFDELDHNSKEIFLRVAWFFKGKCRREIEKALDACGFETSLGIEMLMDRSLISNVEYTSCGSSVERVEMHPLLQLMCHHIVCPGSSDEHWDQSRQWVYEEGTRSVLSNGKGTNIVKGLALRSPHPKEMHFRADTLTNLKKSRRLIMGNVHYVEDPMCLLGDLSWIKCSGYSISNTLFSRPRKFKLQNSGCRAQSFDAARPLVSAPDPSPFRFLLQLSSSRSLVWSHRLRVCRPHGRHPHLCRSLFFESCGNGVLCYSF